MQAHVPASGLEIGRVTHYWNHLGVAGVHLNEPINVGDHIRVLGHVTEFEQDVDSMQIDHRSVIHADAGDDVGIRVVDHVREGDVVYKAENADFGSHQHDL